MQHLQETRLNSTVIAVLAVTCATMNYLCPNQEGYMHLYHY